MPRALRGAEAHHTVGGRSSHRVVLPSNTDAIERVRRPRDRPRADCHILRIVCDGAVANRNGTTPSSRRGRSHRSSICAGHGRVADGDGIRLPGARCADDDRIGSGRGRRVAYTQRACTRRRDTRSDRNGKVTGSGRVIPFRDRARASRLCNHVAGHRCDRCGNRDRYSGWCGSVPDFHYNPRSISRSRPTGRLHLRLRRVWSPLFLSSAKIPGTEGCFLLQRQGPRSRTHSNRAAPRRDTGCVPRAQTRTVQASSRYHRLAQQRRSDDREGPLHRRITDLVDCTALIGHGEGEHVVTVDRHPQLHFVLEHLYRMPNARISDELAGAALDRTEARPAVVAHDPKSIAIQAVAIGDREVENDRAWFFGHANAERLIGREELLGMRRERDERAQDARERYRHDEMERSAHEGRHRAPRCFQAVSARTRPRKTGRTNTLQRTRVPPSTIPLKHTSNAVFADAADRDCEFQTMAIIATRQSKPTNRPKSRKPRCARRSALHDPRCVHARRTAGRKKVAVTNVPTKSGSALFQNASASIEPIGAISIKVPSASTASMTRTCRRWTG
ncbi:hypothetical protein C7S15_8896 (plasmid) [Burkholderia cepacia]|nr:hypothetical protein [Burkholderia cepacia]